MSFVLTAIAVVAQLSANQPLHAQASSGLRGEELMRALQSGGYTILVRHARTDRSAPTKETPGLTPPLRADQRNLTAAGEQDVRLMHAVMQKYRIPIGEVISSPVYRCRETADAFGTPTVTMVLRAFPMTFETEALVSARPKAGTNRVLVTHHFVIEKYVPGITPGDIDESEAAVVRPAADGKVTLVGKIALADWRSLAGIAAGTADAPPAAAPESAAHVEIPATRAGKLAARYIAAFNSGDAARMRTFIETSMLALPDRPIESRLQTYAKMVDDFGVLAVTGIQSTSDDAIAIAVSSKRGNVIVTVTASPAEADRVQSITIGTIGGHS